MNRYVEPISIILTRLYRFCNSTPALEPEEIWSDAYMLTHREQSAPRPSSPVSSPSVGSTTARLSSPTPPGGPKTAIRRKAAADRADRTANARPASTRAAGAGGSSSTMMSMSQNMDVVGLKV
ncbi:Arf guanine nucleotide exchange factor sbh1 [Lambiella insularis]|nr:Arf guanine nucleotide exchange factor sbh1 [Lambiella insularis]